MRRSGKGAAARRAVVVGLDTLVPTLVERSAREGCLPNLQGLVRRGCFSRIRSVIPAQTPANWNTLATGATAGTHGVIQWGTHVAGEAVWETHGVDAFNSGTCGAEYLWEALGRQGERSVVRNYAGYPPTTESAIFIDVLYQPSRSHPDLAAPTVYHDCPQVNAADPVVLQPASSWTDVPESGPPALEFPVGVGPKSGGAGACSFARVWSVGRAYDRVTLASARDGSCTVATLPPGDWSHWVAHDFDAGGTERRSGAFRFKLVELAADAPRLRLDRSDAFPVDGSFCSDAELGLRLVAGAGPYVHSAVSLGVQLSGELDWETAAQIMADEASWWSHAAAVGMDARAARLLFLHWHVLNAVGHSLMGYVEPTRTAYDPSLAGDRWAVVRSHYREADWLFGAFVDRFDDGETVFAIVSDHGMPANRRAVSRVPAFARRGWLALTSDSADVGWSQSKLFCSQNQLWINLRGRDEGGVVPLDECLPLRAEIQATLRDLKDPDTGEHVLAFVLSREDAPMVGLWGPQIGNLGYCYAGGYRWAGPEVLRKGDTRTMSPCEGGNPGPMVTTSETDVGSVVGALILAGPGIAARGRLPADEQARWCTTDLAPTRARLLVVDAPSQSEGHVLVQCLCSLPYRDPVRNYATVERPLVDRPTVRPRPLRLQGDVTDTTWWGRAL